MIKRKKIFLGIISLVFFFLIVLVFALFKFDDRWATLVETKDLFDWLSLVVFRVLLYASPALLLYPISRKAFKVNLELKELYRIQFISYTIVKILWEISALDYLTGVDILNYVDTSIIVVSLFLTLVLKKPTKIEVDIIPPSQD